MQVTTYSYSGGLSASQSANYIHTFDKDPSGILGELKCGALTNTGTLTMTVYDGTESSVSGAWRQLLQVQVTSANSNAIVALGSHPACLFPYAKTTLSVSAGTGIFNSIVSKLYSK